MTHLPDPLYRRIGHEMLRRMTEGELPPGARLPSEVELARQFGVSRQTMRAALGALVRDGRLDRKPGRGTLVVQPKVESRLQRFCRTEQIIRERGLTLTVRVLARGRLHREDELAERACAQFGLARPDEIGYLLRLRLTEGVPLLLEKITFPARLCPALLVEPGTASAPHTRDPGAGSFYEALTASAALRVTHAREVFRPVMLTSYEARLLGLPSSAPAFQIERTSFAADRPIEWRRTLARGDQFTFAVDLLDPVEQGDIS